MDKVEFNGVVSECVSKAELLRRLGKSPSGGSYQWLSKMLVLHNSDISHFTGKRWNKGLTAETDHRVARITGKITIADGDLFVNPCAASFAVVRRRVKANNLVDYACALCGNTGIWRGRKMSLDLDHINGKREDCRLENLRYLCPNCHRTTSTWGRS